ncbi:MAG: hypothetical protein LBV29_01965 [Azoarcus sp.]|nr:hypothetical protein [Azoarcus sp.]
MMLGIAVMLVGIGAGGFKLADLNRQETQWLVNRLYQTTSAPIEAAPLLTETEARLATDLTSLWRAAGFPFRGLLQALESLPQPGVRLRSIALDTQTGNVSATFSLDSAERGLQILDQLNAGQPAPLWKLRDVRESSGRFDYVIQGEIPRSGPE